MGLSYLGVNSGHCLALAAQSADEFTGRHEAQNGTIKASARSSYDMRTRLEAQTEQWDR